MGLAIPGMVFAATAQASVTRSSDATMSGGGRARACNVQVRRSEAPGVFSINREVLQDGSCVCNARTGPASQGGSAEAALGTLLQTRECSASAPLASNQGGSAAGSRQGGGFGTTALILGALAGGGLAAGLTRGGGGGGPADVSTGR